jgi:hypothetical protein
VRPQEVAAIDHRGLRHVALPIAPETIDAARVARFRDEIAQAGARPLYFCDTDGARAGVLWYVHRVGFDKVDPATARREAAGADEVPGLIGRGWERFAELAPDEVAGPVLAIGERPESFAAALSRFPSTLIQGDLKLGNLGFSGDRVVLLDWGTQTGWAPPAVEVAWYLAVNWSRIDATREQVLDDFRAAEGERYDEDALRLALLGGLVQLGWDKALHASGHPDPAVRAREAADLAWWTGRARDALAVWSPS